MESVFVVGVSDAESTHIVSIHKTYEGALKAWNKEREGYIKVYRRIKFYYVSHGYSHSYDDSYNRLIKNLQCEDPIKIDNYPHETPYIEEYEVLS